MMSSPATLCAAEAALCTIAAAEPELQAWACRASPSSLAAPLAGPLSGWPLGVKDIIDVAGMPTRCGSPASSAAPARFDAACVAQLRAAGAVPVGKTVTTEYAYATPGPTRNPANRWHTPGGSSSGSAAAVAAGQVPIALGTQTGGSMIRPAAFCGVVGFKPSAGLVSRDGMKLLCESLDVIGWYGASVAHAEAVAQVLLPHQPTVARTVPDLRLALLPGHPGHVLQSCAANALDRARQHLAAHGVRTTDATAFTALPATHDLLATHATLMHCEFARNLQAVVANHRGLLSTRLLAAVAHGQQIQGSTYLQARRYQDHARAQWQAWFGDADMVLASSVPGPAPEGLATTGDSGFNKAWSVLGWPCIHLPTTRTANGLPLGVMLVAPPLADLDLLAWAKAIHPLVDERPLAPHPTSPFTAGN